MSTNQMAGGFDGVPGLSADSDSDSDKERASPDMAARLKTHAENKKNQKKACNDKRRVLFKRTFHHAVHVAQSGAAAEDAYRRTLECALTKLLCVL
jgi:hypothetical protein